jgi:protein tyrosine phosphatase (PTP) superfamily phosphohydrolase (DUF442 family)
MSSVGDFDSASASDPTGGLNDGPDITDPKGLGDVLPQPQGGFTPPPPPSAGTALLNRLEAIAAKMHLMHPFHTYTKWVDPGVLMRGSELDEGGFEALKAQGVKTVVNLRIEDNSEAPTVEKLGMNAVQIPIYDQSLPSTDEVAAFLKIAGAPENQPVYVHCEQGVGRTGVMCAAFRIAHDGWSADQAVAEAKQMGIASDDQVQFIRQFAADFAAGKYAGRI